MKVLKKIDTMEARQGESSNENLKYEESTKSLYKVPNITHTIMLTRILAVQLKCI